MQYSVNEDKHLTREKYEVVLQTLDSKIYGTFEIKHLVCITGYSKNVIKGAIKRLKEEGRIVPHSKVGQETLYVKTGNSTMRDTRFNELKQKAKEVAGDMGFTAATIAKVLNLSPKEGEKWFMEAIQRGTLVRAAGPWARFKEEEILT